MTPDELAALERDLPAMRADTSDALPFVLQDRARLLAYAEYIRVEARTAIATVKLLDKALTEAHVREKNLRAERDELVRVLRILRDEGAWKRCPSCGNRRCEPTCALDAALAERRT